jgi:hypothetical protein
MTLYADHVAITKDGREVILKTDGTWEYLSGGNRLLSSISSGGFRKSRWGMSPDEVKAAETADLLREGDGLIIYDGKVLGLDCAILYILVHDQLVRAKYVVTAEHSNKTAYLSDFDSLKEMLTKKYGEPAQDNVYWKNDLYRDDYSEWGMAVSIGHLSFFTTWDMDETTVILALNGDNFEINLNIEYTSNELGRLESEAKEQAALDDL